jgi:MFS family permease
VQRRTLPLFLASTVNAFGAGMFFPFALLYYQDATGLTVGTIGTTLTIATAIGLVANPLTGIVVDRIGAKRPVIASQVIEAIGFAGYLLVESRLSLLLAASVATSGSRIFYASFSTLIAETSTGHDTDIWYARTTVAQTIGGTVSGTVAAITIGALGSDGFHIAIGANIACLLLVAVVIRRIETTEGRAREHGGAPGYRSLLRDGGFVAFVIANFAIVTTTMFWGIGSIVYLTGTIGVPLAATSVIGVATSMLVIVGQTRLTSRLAGFDRRRVLAGGCAILAFAFALVGIADRPGMWVGFAITFAGAIALSIATMLFMPSARSLAVRLAPPGLTGRYVSTYELSWGAAAALSPMAFGKLYDAAPSLPWVLAFIVAAGFALAGRRTPQ